MKFTKRQLKLISYCLNGEYVNVESDNDYPWHIWSHLGYGDRDETYREVTALMWAKGSSTIPNEVELKDKQALAELQEVIDIIKRMEEEE